MTRNLAVRAGAGFALALGALAALSLYRETLGVPLFYLALLTSALFWVTQATSWNILSGFSGYFSFGQAAYVGIGAYSTAVLFGRHEVNFYLTILVAAALCALLALGMGTLAFRLRSLRGEIFALLTLAVPFILAAFARISPAVDGGQGIIVGIPDFPTRLGRFQDYLYLLTLVVAWAAVVVAFGIAHSRWGWALAAIRDAEDVAESLGVATFRYKLAALVASAVIGGIGGSIFALQIGFVAVDSVFTLTVPLFVIVMSVLGGRTHWSGPVLGAALVVLLQDRLTAADLGEWQLVVLGVILAVLVVAAPDGLYARLRAATRWLVRRARPRRAVGQVEGRITAGRVAVTSPNGPTSPGRTRPGPAGEVLVRCDGLSRHFGGVRALHDVTLRIHEGELIGLVGPNGSGKTTLVNLLSGSLRPTKGHIHIAGNDIAGLSPHEIVHVGVARTYQVPRPFASMTVRDNVAVAALFGRRPKGGAEPSNTVGRRPQEGTEPFGTADRSLSLAQARLIADEQLAAVGLSTFADAYPATLNLHQRQLLEMARALATAPRLLLLDEALAGLNPVEIDDAVRVVQRIQASGVCIVIVEHLLRVVNQLATRVIVLDRGSCLADGDPQSVMADPQVVRAYLGKRAHA